MEFGMDEKGDNAGNGKDCIMYPICSQHYIDTKLDVSATTSLHLWYQPEEDTTLHAKCLFEQFNLVHQSTFIVPNQITTPNPSKLSIQASQNGSTRFYRSFGPQIDRPNFLELIWYTNK